MSYASEELHSRSEVNRYYFERQRPQIMADFNRRWEVADRLIRSGGRLTDAQIAQESGLRAHMIALRRFVVLRAAPHLPHKELIWLLSQYASAYGLECHVEHSIMLEGRTRRVPDLILCDTCWGPVRWVVEVKSTVKNKTEIRAAVKQVTEYASLLGEGIPVVTAYQVPDVEEIDGVKFWSISRLRAEMERAGAELRHDSFWAECGVVA